MVLCMLSLSDLDTRPKILERPESLDITEESFLYRMRRQYVEETVTLKPFAVDPNIDDLIKISGYLDVEMDGWCLLYWILIVFVTVLPCFAPVFIFWVVIILLCAIPGWEYIICFLILDTITHSHC